ncbi:MAG: tRNA preQ1(34) S-adenosylmethionine ribosyltransferase-isomerase QueA [Candidatus Falkowbacteria bacterium]|nr:tRNA preQ1(34) S-adenosylmethionine ribosyltransferase-isomerase QueA [Candidatus Falkowbacteria bacterium]
MSLLVKDFAYHLPLELIAQQPARPRDHSRLLLLNKKTGATRHHYFYEIIDYLNKGDVLVLNNSKVFPARLIGYKAETGGAVEIFLHQEVAAEKKKKTEKPETKIWECLIGGRVKAGLKIKFLKSPLEAVIVKNNNDGTWQVEFNLRGDKFWKIINKIGFVPLPPYIKRDRKMMSDKNNYQTVFADSRKVGSAAAPTAGFHFTKHLLKKIRAKGVKIVAVTLHVGLGTFAPVKTEKIMEHKMHSEFVEISGRAAKEILAAKQTGGRVIAVGTTSCRTLEAADWEKFAAQLKTDGFKKKLGLKKSKSLKAQAFWTDIFIYPGYKFRVIDALITNFHLPKSTLLMLVSALAGKKSIDAAYKQAVSSDYRFFSYGDAMFIY